MSESGRADRIASRVPAVVVALVIVIGFFLLLPRPLVKPPERVAAPPAQPHTPEPLPELAPKPVDPALVKLRTSGTAVQRDFANDVFQADDPVEKLIAKHKPTLQFGNPDFAVLFYAPNEWGSEGKDHSQVLVVFTHQGKLVQAATRVRTGARQYRSLTFFTGFAQAILGAGREETDWWKTLDAILDLGHPAMVSAHMAVAGPGVWNRVLLPYPRGQR